MIEVASLRAGAQKPNYFRVRIDRTSLLGNPYVLDKESDRDNVINQYELYLKQKLKNPDDPVTIEFTRLVELSKTTDLSLMCWCTPKRCHGDVIKKLITDMTAY